MNMRFAEYDFEYVEIFEFGSTSKEIEEDIISELIIDELNAMSRRVNGSDKETNVLDVLYYVSKYAYFIYRWEERENFEQCGITKTAAVRLINKYYSVEEEKVSSMIIESVASYKENNDEH